MKKPLKVLSFLFFMTVLGSFCVYATSIPALNNPRIGKTAKKKDGSALSKEQKLYLQKQGYIDKKGKWIKTTPPPVQLDEMNYGGATAVRDNTVSVAPTRPQGNQCPNNFFCKVTRSGFHTMCHYGRGTRNCDTVARQCREEENARAERIADGRPADQGSSFPEFSKYCKD